MKVLVIIPAYNEESTIVQTVADLRENCPDVDYLVINDCSTDHTRQKLTEGGIHCLHLPVNLGIGGGVQSGYIYAKEHDYDIAVQFDGDGQHRADYLAKLIQPILDGQADMTVGSRFVSMDAKGFQSSAARRIGIRFLSGLIRMVTGQRVMDVTSGFRAVNRELIAFFAQNYAQDYPEPEAIVSALKYGYRVQEVAVQMRERQGGQSSIRAFQSVYYMIKVSMAILLAGVRIHPVGKKG